MSITMRRKKSEKITYLFVIPIIGHPPKDKNVGEKSSDGGMNRWDRGFLGQLNDYDTLWMEKVTPC